MARYIDADKLIGELHSQFLYDGRDRSRVYAKIQEQPTADVKPVVRAKWLDDFTSDWVCMNCLEPSPSKRYKYCPNCGAKMEL